MVTFILSVLVFALWQNQILTITALIKETEGRQRFINEINAQNNLLKNEIENKGHEVSWQSKLLHTVNDIATILLASGVDEFEKAVWKCMGMLGECMQVDRVYIWKNHVRDGQLRCSQVLEWSEGAVPQQNNEYTVDISFDENAPGWQEKFMAGLSINGLVKNLSQAEQNQLTPQNIISILVLPIFLQDNLWGFMGFDDCHTEREFSEVDESILRSASLLIAHAMLRDEMTQSLMLAREEALTSTKAKSDFLASMSHEIRTPINAITGMSAIARKTKDLGKAHQCLYKIDIASRQLLALINDILDMSKIEAQKLELANEPFELHATMYNIKSIIGVKAAEKKQALSLVIAPEVPEVVVGDDLRLTQVLLNLLSNAVKFTPEAGQIELSLRILKTSEKRHQFEACVKDSGIGIEFEQFERLFNAFEQADPGTSRQFGGTGLGLSISKNIIELMDGKIEVSSSPGQGSCFTVKFYMGRGSRDMLAQKRIARSEEIDFNFSGFTALLAEDIDINREIVLELLEDTGIKVECAENGQLALDMFSANPEQYDIIFMDIHMPEMDGYSATQAIRELHYKEALTVPIIAMTANAFSADVERCLQAGMNDHIAKPINIDVLLEKMSEYLL